MIAAIAEALRLDPHERRHLFTLVETNDPGSPPAPPTADLQAIVDGFSDAPAYITNGRFDVLAHNTVARGLFGDLRAHDGRPRNLMELGFTDPAWRTLIVDWDAEAARHVAMYRAAMALHLDDPTWTRLPDQLCQASPEFRAFWERHDVAGPERRRKRYRHPIAGLFTLESTTLVIADAQPCG